MAEPVKVTVCVSGGLVQWYASGVPCEVTVIDYDVSDDPTDYEGGHTKTGFDCFGDMYEAHQPPQADNAEWGYPHGTGFKPSKEKG